MRHADEGTLHAHLDDELSPAELTEFQAHLAVCAACREQLDEARRVREEAHAILRRADPPPVAAPDFAAILARREQAAPPPATPAQGRPRSLALAWAASVVLALGAGWFAQDLLRQGGTEELAAIYTREAESAPGVAVRDVSAVEAGAPPAAASSPAAAPPLEAAEEPAAAAMRSKAAPQVGGAPAPAALSREAVDADLDFEEPPQVVTLRSAAGAAAFSESAGGWPAAPGWMEVDASGAAQRLGRAALLVPDLAVISYAAAADGSATVRVTQRLPGGELAEILQRRQADGLEILIQAPLLPDSLERLRAMVR